MSYLMTPMQKARLTLDYLSSNGGALPEEVMDRFLMVTIESSDFLQSVTTLKMMSTTKRLPWMYFGSRALHKRTRGEALPDSKRTTPTTAGPTITAYDYASEIVLEREDLESGVEGSGMLNSIMRMLTERVRLDAAEIAIKSSTVSADDDLTNFNGYYTSVTTNTAAAGSTRMSPVNATSLFKTLPAKFQRPGLTIRTGVNAVIDYQNAVQDRPTLLGDNVLDGKWMAHWHGLKMKPDQLFPQNLGGGNDTIAVVSDEKNFNIGFHRQITSDNDKDARAGTIFVVFTVRMGAVWNYEPGTAQLTGILAS